MNKTPMNPVSAMLLALLMSLGLLGGCATTPPTDVPQAQPEPEIVDDYDGDGMLLTLDGSSVKDFEASLARIGRHSDPAVFKTLSSAIDYLLVYDLRAKGKKENLVKLLDGFNGYQVIDQVGWNVPEMEPSPVQKGPTT